MTVRRYVQSTLANWDTTNRINFDPTLIAKSFLHQPIRITYGDGFYAGLPYRQNHQGRSVFCLRTDEGDLGFYCDAVSRYEPRRGEAVRVADGDPQPPVIPADPVDRFELANRHGRPTNIDQWRNVQRLRGVLAASSNADSIVPWKDLEDVTGISREEIERLLPSLERLDPRFQKAEDGIAFDLDSESLREELLGIDAAGLRLALESLKSLGAGRKDVLEDLAEAADLLEARLDIFLNRFSLSTETRVAPCGANVVAAIGALPERFVVRGHRDPVDLEVQGLTWDGSNWWILGQANREELLPGGLCLEDVLEWVDS